MDKSSNRISTGEAVSRYLNSLPADEAGIRQRVLFQFVRWFGRGRSLSDIRAPEIAKYSGNIPATDADGAKKLGIIRDFLAAAKKNGWTDSNMSVHLKSKKVKTRQAGENKKSAPETISLTQQGYDEIRQELSVLKEKRPEIVEDIRRAAADKDFRENAPLDAAREQLGHVEGRIRELEETLKLASIIDDRPEEANRADVGDCVVLVSVDNGEESNYTIVSPREVDPARGRISSSSPLGKAIVGKGCGEVIEITVPAGKMRYRIKKIGR